MKDIDEIRQRVSLVVLAEAAGARFGDAHRLRSHCPLPHHTGDRSSLAFMIYDNGRMWKCHSSCPSDANGGDVIAFYMAWKDVDFKTAVQELSERIGGTQSVTPVSAPRITQYTQPPQWQSRASAFVSFAKKNLNPSVLEYFRNERGLSRETVQAFHVGYNPNNIYDDPARWGLDGKKIWLPRGIVIPGYLRNEPQHIKIRRPLENDALGNYIPKWTPQDGFPEVKVGGPRGGKSVLFRLEFVDHLPVLLLVEGEWDAMLVWEYCADLCDIATLGGAQSKFDTLDLALLTCYSTVLVVHDDDQAGTQGREYIANLQTKIPRLHPCLPPAHDLTDFWKAGGDLRGWVAKHIASAFEDTLRSMKITSPQIERYKRVLSLAMAEPNP